MKLAEGFFDFLRGDNNPVSQNNSIEKESCRSWNDNEKWFLYTFSPQSSECSLNCLFVTNYFRTEGNALLSAVKEVKCDSCSPNGNLPIMVAESDGLVLEYAEIMNRLIKIDNVSLFVGVESSIGRYIRSFEDNNSKYSNINVSAVLELINSLNKIEDLSVLESSVQIFLFSVIQAAKLRLLHTDPVRLAIEKSESLGELFLKVLSRFPNQ